MKGIEHLDQAVGAVAQAEPIAQSQLRCQAGRKLRQRQVGEAVVVDSLLRVAHAVTRRQPVLTEHLLAGDAPVVLAQAVHQNRHAMTTQEQRQQRCQVGTPAGAVVARDDDRPGTASGALQESAGAHWRRRESRPSRRPTRSSCAGRWRSPRVRDRQPCRRASPHRAARASLLDMSRAPVAPRPISLIKSAKSIAPPPVVVTASRRRASIPRHRQPQPSSACAIGNRYPAPAANRRASQPASYIVQPTEELVGFAIFNCTMSSMRSNGRAIHYRHGRGPGSPGGSAAAGPAARACPSRRRNVCRQGLSMRTGGSAV
jgi:hypothetical protein